MIVCTANSFELQGRKRGDMLKSALLYKKELENKFAEIMYDDEYYLYMGYVHGHELPKIEPQDNVYQWAIVDDKDDVIGYFTYQIQVSTDTVLNFGLYSFDRGNVLVGIDVFNKMEELVKEHHRIEWRMIGGNPIKKSYDRFYQKHNGNCVVLHSVTKDMHGKWHDKYIYEIVREDVEA